jgi:hypothetical protein
MVKIDRPLRRYFYVAGKQMYEELGDGRVKVIDQYGRSGIFSADGPYIEGDVTQANLHMLVYTGGPNIPAECNFRWSEVPVDPRRPSGWPEEIEPFVRHHLGKR